MSPQRAKKLKETCDSCSASKVKCDKRWPQCSRCEHLTYPCFYSPARRKGRPHPTINHDGRKKSEESSEKSSTQESLPCQTNDTNPQVASRRSEIGPQLAIAKEEIQRRHQHRQGYGAMSRLQARIPTHHLEALSSQDPPNSPSQRLDTCGSSTSTGSPTTISSPATRVSTVSSTASIDDSTNPWPAKSSYNDHDSNTDSPNDCALLAMKTLQHLSGESILQHGNDADGSTSEIQLHTASTAIKRLSTIFICPCSQKADVGLLTVALCAAILDLYESILQGSIDDFAPPSTAVNSIFQLTSNPKQATVQRVLEELPKAASIVMQFTRRYNGVGDTVEPKGRDDILASLLPTLAMEQRARLKDMVDKATSLLAMAV
ncbi:MAG: hypothetical protein L6R40_007857 [Gallowayella cf. fulva]|nr:MAG: hypothetical protein L6R40_007857 [Xanthomendoza cf. fulva]